LLTTAGQEGIFSHCRQTVAQGFCARDLSFLENGAFDLILTHPPYMNIIKYFDGKIPADLSKIKYSTAF